MKPEAYKYYDRGLETLDDAYLNSFSFQGKNLKEMQQELANEIGYYYARYLTFFYLIYAYKKLKAGKPLHDVMASCRAKMHQDFWDRRQERMRKKQSESIKNFKTKGVNE